MSSIRQTSHTDFPAMPLAKPVAFPAKPRRVSAAVNTQVKRVLDVLFTLVVLSVFAPIMALIAIALKVSSRGKGSILFRQERVGKNGKLFHITKFRTMIENAEAQTGPVWSGDEDPRITKLGKFLRYTHLDELPQLFNVLRGDMSFVGPRPERPCFVAKFQKQGVQDIDERHLVLGGISGYAQLIHPFPDIDQIQDKVDADIWYIEHWTPMLDLWIIWKTFQLFVNSFVQVFKRIFMKSKLSTHGILPEHQR